MKVPETVEMTLKEIKDVLIERFLRDQKNPKSKLRPIYLEGHAGIGKSQIIKQVAEALTGKLERSIGCQTLNLQFCERPDFLGLPMIDQNGNTVFARPKFLPKDGAGILFLDEANRVDPDIQSGMLTLLEDRNINGHQIGDGWMIVLAGNPNGSIGGVRYRVSEFDQALTDRLAKISVKGSIPDLVKYLEQKYPKHILLKFLDYLPDFITFDGQGCSPRSFEYAMRATEGISKIDDPYLIKCLAIELGTQSAHHIVGVLESGFIPTIKHVLDRDTRAYNYLTSNGDRQDVLLSLIEQIYHFICDNAERNTPIDRDNASAIIEFLMLSKDEHRIALFEKIRGSKYAVFFGQHFLKNTRLAEVLYAKRATAS